MLFFVGIGIVLGLTGWMVFRNKILNYAWDKATNKLETKGYLLQCETKGFSGLFTTSFTKIKLSLKQDTFVTIEKLDAGIAVIKSIFEGPTLSDLQMDKSRIELVKTPVYCNFCGLSEKKEKTTSTKPFVQRIFDLLKRSVSKIPSTLILNDFVATYQDSSDTMGISIPNVKYKNKDIAGTLHILENENRTSFAIAGTLNRSSLKGKLIIKPVGKKWAELPVIKRKFNLSAGFEEADFELEKLDMDDGVLRVVADGHFQGITVDDRRLADTTVIIKSCSGKLVANFSKDFIEIDSATSLILNKITTHLYASAKLGNDKSYSLKFKANRIKANDFFTSLPEGMFRNLQGIEATGELEYAMQLQLSDNEPYKTIFESELIPYNFKITKMGATDLAKMNGSFMHTFYERGKAVRTFPVGPSNPSFTPIGTIPQSVQTAVMTGEDPMFFGHNGFYKEAIRQSIIQNYVQKRFARGGSTISMQLVKNVFLSRKKTLSRKAEEILIVWLIESQHITTKSRMFEVYLNIIEWGPGVFGIGEAAPFYFAKNASSLTPLECAFLASIVPMPKNYAYFIDSAGFVSDRDWNFVAIRNNMIRHGDIDSADSASFNVKIVGPAARFLRNRKPLDSIPESDLLFPELIPKKE